MVKLASDMASFNNADPTEVLESLRSGLAGETEPLRKFGVFLNDARLKAEAMALGLYNGKGALDAQAKAAATYSIILKDTKDAQGDFADTSDSLANQQRIVKASLEDAAASIGKFLLPAVTKAISAFREMIPAIRDAISGIAKVVGPALEQVAGLFGEVGGVIKDTLGKVDFGPFINAIKRLGGDVAAALGPLLAGWKQYFESLMDVVAGIMPSIQRIITAVVDAVGPVIRDLGKIFGDAFAAIGKALQEHQPEIERIFDRLAALVENVVIPAFKLLAAVALPIIKLIFVEILPVAIGAAITALDLVTGAIETVVEIFKTLSNTSVGEVFDALVDAIQGALRWISDFGRDLSANVVGALKAIPSAVAGAATAVLDAAKGVGSAIWDGIKAGIGALGALVVAYVRAELNIIGSLVGFVVGLARNLGEAVWDGIKTGAANLAANTTALVRAAFDGIRSLGSFVVGLARNLGESIWDGIKAALGALGGLVVAALKAELAGIQAVAGFVLGLARKVGDAIIDGIVAGVKAAAGVLGAIKEKLFGALESAKDALVGAVKGLGRWIWEQVLEGLKNAPGSITGAIEDKLNIPGFLRGGLKDKLFNSFRDLGAGAGDQFWEGVASSGAGSDFFGGGAGGDMISMRAPASAGGGGSTGGSSGGGGGGSKGPKGGVKQSGGGDFMSEVAGAGSITALGSVLQKYGYIVGEHPAFGGVSSGHTNGSYHYVGQALDINHAGNEPGYLDSLAAALSKNGNVVELIWRAEGHYDHLHVAFGPVTSSGSYMKVGSGGGAGTVPGGGGGGGGSAPAPPAEAPAKQVAAAQKEFSTAVKNLVKDLPAETVPEIKAMMAKIRAALGDDFITPAELEKIQAQIDKFRENLKRVHQVDSIQDGIKKAWSQLKKALEPGDMIPPQLAQEFDKVNALIRRFLKDGVITEAELAKIQAQRDKLRDHIENFIELDSVRDGIGNAMDTARRLFKEGFIDEEGMVAVDQGFHQLEALVERALKDGIVTDAEIEKIREQKGKLNDVIGQAAQEAAKSAREFGRVADLFKTQFVDRWITSSELAALKAKAANVKGAIGETLNAAVTAVETAYANFEKAWGEFKTGLLAAFDQQIVGKLRIIIDRAALDLQLAQAEDTILRTTQRLADLAGTGITEGNAKVQQIARDLIAGLVAGNAGALNQAELDLGRFKDIIKDADKPLLDAIKAVISANDALLKAQASGTEEAIAKAQEKLKAATDALRAQLEGSIAEMGEGLDAADREVYDAVQRVIAATKAYYDAVASGNAERIAAARTELVDAQGDLSDLEAAGISERAQNIVQLGQQIIGAEQTLGQNRINAALAEYEALQGAVKIELEKTINAAAEGLRNGTLTFDQALGMIKDKMTEHNISTEAAASLLGKAATDPVKTAFGDLSKAIDNLNTTLQKIADALAGKTPAIGTAATGAANALTGPFEKANITLAGLAQAAGQTVDQYIAYINQLEAMDVPAPPGAPPPPGGGGGGSPQYQYMATGGVAEPSPGGLVRGVLSAGIDKVLARLTPGELVLNRPQQARLSKVISGMAARLGRNVKLGASGLWRLARGYDGGGPVQGDGILGYAEGGVVSGYGPGAAGMATHYAQSAARQNIMSGWTLGGGVTKEQLLGLEPIGVVGGAPAINMGAFAGSYDQLVSQYERAGIQMPYAIWQYAQSLKTQGGLFGGGSSTAGGGTLGPDGAAAGESKALPPGVLKLYEHIAEMQRLMPGIAPEVLGYPTTRQAALRLNQLRSPGMNTEQSTRGLDFDRLQQLRQNGLVFEKNGMLMTRDPMGNEVHVRGDGQQPLTAGMAANATLWEHYAGHVAHGHGSYGKWDSILGTPTGGDPTRTGIPIYMRIDRNGNPELVNAFTGQSLGSGRRNGLELGQYRQLDQFTSMVNVPGSLQLMDDAERTLYLHYYAAKLGLDKPGTNMIALGSGGSYKFSFAHPDSDGGGGGGGDGGAGGGAGSAGGGGFADAETIAAWERAVGWWRNNTPVNRALGGFIGGYDDDGSLVEELLRPLGAGGSPARSYTTDPALGGAARAFSADAMLAASGLVGSPAVTRTVRGALAGAISPPSGGWSGYRRRVVYQPPPVSQPRPWSHAAPPPATWPGHGASRPIIVNINVEGSVVRDRELAETMRDEFERISRRNGGLSSSW